MVETGGRDTRCLLGSVTWLVLVMSMVAASCDYPGLSRLSGPDAPGGDGGNNDGPGSDGPGDGPSPAARCMDLAATCGPNQDADCCQVAMVPGGTFFRSYDGSGVYGDMSFPATLSTFVLDKYEVTVGRFRAFVAAGRGTQASPPTAGAGSHPNLAGSGWQSNWNANLTTDMAALVSAVKCSSGLQTWTDTPGVNENKPMNCVTWYEAMAFCIWDGGYLPTEAEWNYAASGGGEQRVYPWSSPPSSVTIDCKYTNYMINNPSGSSCVNGPNPVGSEPMGDGRWGHSGIAGNVLEWTLDWDSGPYPVPCNDCANLTSATVRVFRGGSFLDLAPSQRASARGGSMPSSRFPDIGLRCARTPS